MAAPWQKDKSLLGMLGCISWVFFFKGTRKDRIDFLRLLGRLWQVEHQERW